MRIEPKKYVSQNDQTAQRADCAAVTRGAIRYYRTGVDQQEKKKKVI